MNYKYPFKPEYENLTIKEVWFCILNEGSSVQFGIRFFKANKFGFPGEDLLQKPLIIKSRNFFKSGQKYIEKVKILDLNIAFPKEGLFVGLERLIIPQNAYPMPGAPNSKYKLYNPSLQTIDVSDSLQNNLWHCYNSKWENTKGSQNIRDKNGNIIGTKRVYRKFAISLLLTD